MLIDKFGVSERRSCTVLGINRSTIRYQLTLIKSDQPIIDKMKELAFRHRRYGYPRLHILLRREGLVINRKKTQRIYSQQGLSLRLKRKKKKQFYPRIVKPMARKSNDVWSMDFVSDSLTNGRRVRSLTIIDHYTRFSPAIYVDYSISGEVVTKQLDRLIVRHGKPIRVQVDNGPEFTF